MRFEDLKLSDRVTKNISILGWTEPTPIQESAIPFGISGRDIVGCAQTGTGKTAAFAIPIIERLLSMGQPQGPDPRALILVPTRELAVQVEETFRGLLHETGLHCVPIFGGVPIQAQTDILKRGVDIIVATPGRLLDHVERRNVSFGKVAFLVLDEADRMLDMGFAPDIYRILRMLPDGRQSMLFSATIPPQIERLANRTLRNPETIEAGRRSTTASGVQQVLYWVLTSEKIFLLLCLLDRLSRGPTLVFCRTKRGADEVCAVLKRLDYNVAAIHADRSQDQRQAALAGFRDGTYEMLVATDIAARGLDINGITHVINFDIPEYSEDYIHRVGRTARAGEVGDAITLVDPWEESFVRSIEKLIGEPIAFEPLPEGFLEYKVPPPTAQERAERAKDRERREAMPGNRGGGGGGRAGGGRAGGAGGGSSRGAGGASGRGPRR